MKKANTTVMGVIECGWGHKYVMPLEVAHQIQALLAKHADNLNDDYAETRKRVAHITKLEVPGVTVYDPQYPLFDCTDMHRDDVNEWRSAISEALKEEGATARDIVPPDVWLAMKGE